MIEYWKKRCEQIDNTDTTISFIDKMHPYTQLNIWLVIKFQREMNGHNPLRDGDNSLGI